MDNILKEKYPHMRTDRLAELLGLKKSVVYNRAFALGLKKSEEFLRSPECGRITNVTTRGIMHQFMTGNIPYNKGKKQTEYMTAQQIERTKETRFKKGHLPVQTLYDGAIAIRRHKREGKSYKWIRISLGKWVEYHRYLWEREHGPIPAGHNIQFRDGDTLNCDLSNLYMISQADQLRHENSFHARYPEEIKKLIQLKGALKRQINKQNKK